MYPTSFLDADRRPLDAAKRYVLHFAPGDLPPVNAFWSISLYGPDSFFVANPIDRHAVSSWMPLARNRDGSLDLYVQHESPGAEREANWLPAPASGAFNLTLRMYWPQQAVLDGSWQPPGARASGAD